MATDNSKDVINYDLPHDEPELQYLWMGSGRPSLVCTEHFALHYVVEIQSTMKPTATPQC
eukprot:16437439-Heterocapsa_arctica.AAC.1